MSAWISHLCDVCKMVVLYSHHLSYTFPYSTLLYGKAFLFLLFIHLYQYGFMSVFDSTDCNPLLSFILMLKLLLGGRSFQLATQSISHVSLFRWTCPYFLAQVTSGPAFTLPSQPWSQPFLQGNPSYLYEVEDDTQKPVRAYYMLIADGVSLHVGPLNGQI